MNTKEYENAVLGHILLTGEIPDGITSDMFSDKIGREIFECILEVEHIDPLSVSHRLKSMGYKNAGSIVSDIHKASLSVTNINGVVPLLREGSSRRLIEETVIAVNDMNLSLTPVEEMVGRLEKVITSIHSHRPEKTMKDILHKTLEGIENRVKAPQGWCYDLNKITKGFNPTDLMVYAGRPSMGKTALALCDFNHLTVTEGIPSLFLSLEMGDTQITSRLLSINTGIELEKIMSNNLSAENWKSLTDTAAIMSKAPMFMDDRGGISIYEVGASIRRHHKENKIQVVFIDYLQLILTKTKSDNRNNEVAFITSYLKGLAKELNICVVVLSQLNREVETRKDKRPMLSDLRDSGAIEQDADIVIFPFRPSWYENTQDPDELIVAKHRNGALGKVKVLYQGFLTRFVNLSRLS